MSTWNEVACWLIFILILLGFAMWVLSVIAGIISRCISVDQNPPLSEKDTKEKTNIEVKERDEP
jgi:TRAP-type mannitol/chloroaromatic compound transport system permease small subunit